MLLNNFGNKEKFKTQIPNFIENNEETHNNKMYRIHLKLYSGKYLKTENK